MRRKLLGNVDKVDTNAGCGELVVMAMGLRRKHTLEQSRCSLRHVFDQHLAPTVQ